MLNRTLPPLPLNLIYPASGKGNDFEGQLLLALARPPADGRCDQMIMTDLSKVLPHEISSSFCMAAVKANFDKATFGDGAIRKVQECEEFSSYRACLSGKKVSSMTISVRRRKAAYCLEGRTENLIGDATRNLWPATHQPFSGVEGSRPVVSGKRSH